MHPFIKKRENIVEFILLMYQIEELIRILSFEEKTVLSLFTGDSENEDQELRELRTYYRNIMSSMRTQGIEKSGHLEEIKEIVLELIYLHNTLIAVLNDEKYKGLCEACREDIQVFRIKSKLEQQHEVEVLLHAMFMKMQLKLRKQEIGSETEESMDKMRLQLAYLSREYKKMKSGEWNFIQN
ncbi:MAG: DUF4924 family protein [Bacteroidetes bacterium]|nr:DUF4924 family protein [Bacteroidota bacterium]